MAKQTFTAGQVLTAAQMNSLQANDYNWTVDTKTDSYVLVAGDAGKRIVMNAATAKTITVNTSVFTAGDVVWIHNINSGVCTVTAGTATVTSAGSLAIPQWGGGALFFTSASAAIYFPQAVTATTPGLVRISTTTATSGSSLNITNAFSSTYNTYLIVIDDLLYNTGGGVLRMTLGATATGYYWGRISVSYAAGTVTTDFGSNTTSFTVGQGDNTNKSGATIIVTNPNLAATTGINSLPFDPRTAEATQTYQGFVNNTTQYTDFTLTPGSSRTFANVSVKVYGYAQ